MKPMFHGLTHSRSSFRFAVFQAVLAAGSSSLEAGSWCSTNWYKQGFSESCGAIVVFCLQRPF